jgi:amino acid adenylation domain-containing protein
MTIVGGTAISTRENGTSLETLGDSSVQELFASHATTQPDALAVSGPDATLTYGQLERHTDQLARRLRALGVGRERPVGLCLGRSAALVVGALGILKAGGAYVALDPAHPRERLGFMLRDCGADVLVTGGSAAAGLDTGRAAVVTVDAGCAEPEPELESTVEQTATGGRDLAYVIYTSGSTGTPKGVLLEHAGLRNLVSWHQHAFAISGADRATQIASPAFDATVWELWPYLTAGASIHIPTDEVRADPVALRDWLVAERISVTFVPTAIAEVLMTLDWPAETSLRYLLTGGDTLHRHPPAGLPFTVVNNYGPSEATVVATSGVVGPSADDVGAPSIGRPITNVQAYAVDDQLDRVATGSPGELLVGGAQVARGYLNRACFTDERFIPDPFSSVPGARVYRTGDLVRERPDGEIEFLGRVDEQVKILGNRIELGEISATLNRHVEVRSSVVVVREHASDERHLIAYVVAVDGRRPDSTELRAHLGQHLPTYMVPAAFVWLEELPLTPNGKVDRAALPAPVSANTAQPAQSAQPGSELEEVLAALVAELLELDRVGADENFFMLGGHSMLGAQLIARIGERFDVDMSLRALFDNPTVAEMATEVERLLVADLEEMSDDDAARLLAESREAPFETVSDEHGARR